MMIRFNTVDSAGLSVTLVYISGGGDRDNQQTGQQERPVSAMHQARRHPSQQAKI